ncbi:unnamed protein product [Calypogeia fissa]
MDGGRLDSADLLEIFGKDLTDIFKTIDTTRYLSLLESLGMNWNRVQVIVSSSLKDQVDHLPGKRKIGLRHLVAFKVMARAQRLASLRIFGLDCSDGLKNNFERQGFEYLAKLDDAANVVKILPSMISLLAEHDKACKKESVKARISIIDNIHFLEEIDLEMYEDMCVY